MKTITRLVALISALLLGDLAAGESHRRFDFDLTLRDVSLRPDVVVDIHVNVRINERQPCNGKSIFAIPGLFHTAATWRPFVASLFEVSRGEDSDDAPAVCKVISMDLPGHGDSGLPSGLLFGDLLLEDYVTAIIATVRRLRTEHNLKPKTILAHSQGGLLVQLVQQRLLDEGTSLRRALKIRRAILMASVGPAQVPFFLAESGAAAAILGAYLAFEETLGSHFDVPNVDWVGLFFTNAFGAIVPGAPSPDEVEDNGWNAPAPLLASLQLVGADPFTRPSVDPGIFSAPSLEGDEDSGAGTELVVVTYEHDILILATENELLYEYLTEDFTRSGVVLLTGEDAVHDMHVSAPDRVVDALSDLDARP